MKIIEKFLDSDIKIKSLFPKNGEKLKISYDKVGFNIKSIMSSLYKGEGLLEESTGTNNTYTLKIYSNTDEAIPKLGNSCSQHIYSIQPFLSTIIQLITSNHFYKNYIKTREDLFELEELFINMGCPIKIYTFEEYNKNLKDETFLETYNLKNKVIPSLDLNINSCCVVIWDIELLKRLSKFDYELKLMYYFSVVRYSFSPLQGDTFEIFWKLYKYFKDVKKQNIDLFRLFNIALLSYPYEGSSYYGLTCTLNEFAFIPTKFLKDIAFSSSYIYGCILYKDFNHNRRFINSIRGPLSRIQNIFNRKGPSGFFTDRFLTNNHIKAGNINRNILLAIWPKTVLLLKILKVENKNKLLTSINKELEDLISLFFELQETPNEELLDIFDKQANRIESYYNQLFANEGQK